jgi:site-specific recombinase XerD
MSQINHNPPVKQKPKLLDQVRHVLRTKHYKRKTEKAYVQWIKRFILFHNKRHPKEMGEEQINQFLSYLAVNENVSASTQNQALCAIVFLYKHVIKEEVGDLGDVIWAKKPQKLPEVFTQEEAQDVIANLEGVYWIIGVIMYGSGMRLIECLHLRVKDIDFSSRKITVSINVIMVTLQQQFRLFYSYMERWKHENKKNCQAGTTGH